MDICNENLTSTSITRVDSLIFGYLNRQQYTKTVTALLEESPVLRNVGGRFGGGREIFIQINPTVCDKDLEYIVETFAQYGRFDVPPEFIDFGQQLRCLANDFSRMTSVLGFSRSDNQQKMYGSRAKVKSSAAFAKESYNPPHTSTPTVYHIPQHPLTVDSPTPQSLSYSRKPLPSNNISNDANIRKTNERVNFDKSSSQGDKSLLHSNPCDIQNFPDRSETALSNSNNLDPPIHCDDQDPSNMHSMLSDEGSSRRKRQHPHSYSERFVSKLADAASRTKQCKEQFPSTTTAAELSTLDIGNEIYDLFDIRNLPSQLEEVVCRFDPEDRFYDFAGFMEMEDSHDQAFEQNNGPSLQMLEDQTHNEFSSFKQTVVPNTPIVVPPPKESQPEPVISNNLTLMPQPVKEDLTATRPYVMKGPRGVTSKKTSKSLTERPFINNIKIIEAKNVPLRTKITMDSLFDDDDSSSSESITVMPDKQKRSKSPDLKKKKDAREDLQKSREHAVKEKKLMEKQIEKRKEERREERDTERRKHDKDEKRHEEHRKTVDMEKQRVSREKPEDRKKHDRFRDETDKREYERRKKEQHVRSAREQENQRREEAMKRREEEKRRNHEEKKRVEHHRDDDKHVVEDLESSRDEDRRVREKRRTIEEETSSHEAERSEREASQESLSNSSSTSYINSNPKLSNKLKTKAKESNAIKSKSWESKNREEYIKKKRVKDPNSSSMPDIFGEIEKNLDSLRRHDRSPSPEIAFINIKKLAPSTKIPKKVSEHTQPPAEKYIELEPVVSLPPPVITKEKEADLSIPSSTQSSVRDIQPSTEHVTTATTSKVSSKSVMVCGLPCDEPNLLIRSTVNDARIGLQFESAAVKWRRTPSQDSSSTKSSAEKEQDSRKRSSQNTLNIGKLFTESGSPKDTNKKKIKLDLSAIESIMKKVHGNTSSTP